MVKIMKSIQQYKKELTKIATDLGIEGPSVDYLTSIVAYNIYELAANQLVINQELDPDRAQNIDNVINYCVRHLYNLFSGYSTKVVVTAVSETPIDMPKGTVLYKGDDYNLVLESSITKPKGSNLVLNLIACDGLHRSTVTDLNTTTYAVELNAKDVSQDYRILVSKEGSNSMEEVKSTTEIREHLTGFSNPIPLVLTSPNYSKVVYFNDRTSGIQSVQIEYFDYKEVPSHRIPKDLKLPGFNIQSVKINQFTPRLGIGSGVGYLAKHNMMTQNILRSVYDFNEEFLRMFKTKGVKSSTTVITDGNANIYYIADEALPSSLIDKFKSRIATLGQDQSRVVTHLATPRNITVKVSLKSSDLIDTSELNKMINKYSMVTGILIDLASMEVDITKRFNNLTWIRSEIVGVSDYKMQLPPNEYLVIEDIIYEYI